MNTEAMAQEKAAEAQMQAELQRMLSEVKKKMKCESKNELIRIIGALLLDNYALKMRLAASQQENTNAHSS